MKAFPLAKGVLNAAGGLGEKLCEPPTPAGAVKDCEEVSFTLVSFALLI